MGLAVRRRGQPEIVHRKVRRGGLGAAEVRQPRELQPGVERAVAEVVQQAGDVVREVPHAAQCGGRVLVGRGRRAVLVISGGRTVIDREGRCPAIHVFARGLLRHLTTRICFDQAAVPDAVPADRRETLVAERTDDGYRFDIRIHAHPPERETVFDV